MAAQDLAYLSIAELGARLRRGDVSPVEVTRAALDRASALNPRLNAFLTITADVALEQAQRAEEEIRQGQDRGPLHGVPVAVKDLFYTRGIRTTGGSRILADFVPDYDATPVARLREAGAILLGKLHLHEFAYGPTGNNHHYGPGHNPWSLDHLPGGSSSGSGAAVAAGIAYGALGTDTGGSVRIPSALCGITGVKPTFGRVSLHGCIPLCWTLDHVGPMARSAEDCAILLQAIAGHDPNDRRSLPHPVPDYRQTFTEELTDVRLGVPREDVFKQARPEVLAAVRQAQRVLESLGAHIEEVSIPLLDEAFSASTVLLMAEATACHMHTLRDHAEEYDPEVRRRIESGLALPAALYIHAQRVREALKRQMHQVLRQVDAIISPAVPVTAPPITGERVVIGQQEEDTRRLLTNFTRPYNLTGQPSVVVPCGFSSNGLPISLQIGGRPLEEGMVLCIAHAYQRATDWHTRRPPVESYA